MGFLFFPMMPMGLRLAALRAAGAPLKHVLKFYDNCFDVHNSRKRVVGLIYTKQLMS